NRCRSSGRPALAAEQNAMVAASNIEVVNLQARPVEVCLQLVQRVWLELFVDLDRKQQFLLATGFGNSRDDLRDGRLSPPQVEPLLFVERLAPGRGDEHNDGMIAREVAPRQQGKIVAMVQLDGPVKAGNVVPGELVHLNVHFKSDAV